MPSASRSSGVISYRLAATSWGSSYLCSMPSRPAASTTAKARYGLHAGSGARYSMRVESSLPGLACGTFTTTERLLRAQAM